MKRSLELRQERSALYDEAQKLMPPTGQKWTSENRTKFDAMVADMDVMKADIDRLEKAESLGDELRAGTGTQKVNGSARVASYREDEQGEDPKVLEAQQRRYRKAFDNYLRRGMNSISPEDLNILRSQGKSAEYRSGDQDPTTGPGGGFLIPTGFQRELEIALKQFGGVRQAARTITTATGAALPWPTTNDTGIMGRRLGATAITNPAVVQGQAFGNVSFNAWTYTSDVIRIPNELLNDSAFDLEAEVRDRFAERIGRIQNNEFTLYAGAGGPTGFLGASQVAVHGATGETTSCTYDDVINLQHGIDPAYRQGAAYMFHDQTLNFLRRLKDNYGRPLFGPGTERRRSGLDRRLSVRHQPGHARDGGQREIDGVRPLVEIRHPRRGTVGRRSTPQ